MKKIKKTRLFTCKVKRSKDNRVTMYLKLHHSMAQMFITENSAQSTKHNTRYYGYTIDTDRMVRDCTSCSTDQYGEGLIRNGYANISLLRTVDIDKGVVVAIPDRYTLDQLKHWSVQTSEAIKKLYEQLVRPVVINVNVEV